MPSGPFGFPRITGLGPLSSDIDDFSLETDKRPLEELDKSSNVLPVLADEGLLSEPTRVTVTVFDEGGMIYEHDSTVTIGKYDYIYSEKDGAGVIGSVNVRERIRRLGIGREMMKQMHRNLEELGIDSVWTSALSDEGEALLQRAGYSQTAPHFEDRDDVYFRTLNPQ